MYIDKCYVFWQQKVCGEGTKILCPPHFKKWGVMSPRKLGLRTCHENIGHMPRFFVAYVSQIFGARATTFCGMCHNLLGRVLYSLWHMPHIL